MNAEEILNEPYNEIMKSKKHAIKIIKEHGLLFEDYINDSKYAEKDHSMFCVRSILEWLGY
jgi:hypothetical protein